MPLSISNIKKAKILSNFFRPRLRNYLGSGELLPFKDGNGAGLDPKPTRLIHNRRGLGRVYFSPLGSAGSGPQLQVRPRIGSGRVPGNICILETPRVEEKFGRSIKWGIFKAKLP